MILNIAGCGKQKTVHTNIMAKKMMKLSFMRHLGLHFAAAAFPAKNP